MKKSMLVVLALTTFILVACNKTEQPTTEVTAEATATEAVVGHDVEHQHVEAGADHEHDQAHHEEHDHKAHHPDHQE